MYISRTRNANVHDAIEKIPDIRINQYRPSFSIQLLLRMTRTPHLVFNSSNAFSESEGPLPTLTDLKQKAAVGSKLSENRLSGCLNYLLYQRQNKIEDYGSSSFGKIFDLYELTDGQRAERTYLMSQYLELSLIQKCLKYGHRTTWEELYKKQSMKAHCYPYGNPDEMTVVGLDSNNTSGYEIFSGFPIWAERVLVQQEIESESLGRLLLCANSSINDKDVNVTKAVTVAKQAYQSLNWKLGQSAKGNLLDTEDLSVVDFLLFDHLAEALCNVHLVTILGDYDYLVAFFQNNYEKYFSKRYLQTHGQPNAHWIKWNDNVNALNQFNRIPVNDVERKIRDKLSDEGYQSAFKIMQSMALHCRDLKVLLKDAAQLRREEDKLYGVDSVPQSKKGKWIQMLLMGGDLDPSKLKKSERKDEKKNNEDNVTQKNEELLKKALREARQNDELWISATICATVLSLALSLSVGEE